MKRMGRVVIISVLAMLGGCATAQNAEYLDLKTGQSYVCYRQTAFGVIPAIVSNNSYADCKSNFEARGFIRRDARTDAILKHVDPKLSETLAAPVPAPTTGQLDDASQRIFCRNRAANAGGSDAWSAAYWRCMAGY